jgi:hypothetical protein
MYDSVSTTLEAPACLATLASASWAVRNSATSTSGCIAPGRPRGGDLGRHAVQAGPAVHHLGERLGQARGRQRLRAHRLDRAAGLRQALPRQLRRVLQVAAPVGRPVAGALRRLDLRDDPGQALGEGVVDLPRHALALVEHPRLPRLGQQLGVQPLVLGHRRLELVVGLGELGDHPLALLVLIGHRVAQAGEHGGGRHDDDHQDHEGEAPGQVGRWPPAEDRGDVQDRGGRHPGQPPPAREDLPRVQVPGDGEQPEPRVPGDQDRDEGQQAQEVDGHQGPSPRPLRVQGDHPQHPRGGEPGDAQRPEPVGLRPVAERPRQDRRGRQQDVGHQAGRPTQAPLPGVEVAVELGFGHGPALASTTPNGTA